MGIFDIFSRSSRNLRCSSNQQDKENTGCIKHNNQKSNNNNALAKNNQKAKLLYCSNCSALMEKDSLFCSNCGEMVRKADVKNCDMQRQTDSIDPQQHDRQRRNAEKELIATLEQIADKMSDQVHVSKSHDVIDSDIEEIDEFLQDLIAVCGLLNEK